MTDRPRLKANGWLGLGTNLGDRAVNLEQALVLLEQRGIYVVVASSWYSTPPWGLTEQEPFLNMVAGVHFSGTAEELLTHALETEREMGRIREQKWGPRLIDIDVLDFKGLEIRTPVLTLPHPYIAERGFVLMPWAEIAPEHRPAGSGNTIREMLDYLPESEKEVIRPVRERKNGD